MEKTLISVIIPVYNAEKTLRRCVESILAQTFTNFELLLINDGSRDQSGEICDSYALQDKRLRVFHQSNRGVALARNAGLEHATGKYICFVDADDWVEPPYLESFLVDELKQDESLFVMQDFTEERIDRIHKNAGFPDRLFHPEEFGDLLFHQGTYYVPGTPFPKLYHAKTLNEHHIRFNPQVLFGDDLIFFLEYMKYAKSVKLLSAAHYHYINFLPQTLSRRHFSHESERAGFTIISSLLKDLVNQYHIGELSEKPVNEISGLYLLRAFYSLYRKGSRKKAGERFAVLRQLHTAENLLFLRIYLQNSSHRHLFWFYRNRMLFLFDLILSGLFFLRSRLAS